MAGSKTKRQKNASLATVLFRVLYLYAFNAEFNIKRYWNHDR